MSEPRGMGGEGGPSTGERRFQRGRPEPILEMVGMAGSLWLRGAIIAAALAATGVFPLLIPNVAGAMFGLCMAFIVFAVAPTFFPRVPRRRLGGEGISRVTSAGDGPFREGLGETIEGARRLEVVRSTRRMELDLPQLFLVIGLGPVVAAIVTGYVDVGLSCVLGLVLALGFGLGLRQRDEVIRRADASPRRVRATETGLLIEDGRGPRL